MGQTGDILGDITNQINNIATLIADIVRGTEEQSSSLGEIDTGKSQLDSVTQSNATNVEKATGAGQLLQADASGLTERVAFFQVRQRAQNEELDGTWAAE